MVVLNTAVHDARPAVSAGSRRTVKSLALPLTAHRQFDIVRRPPTWLGVEMGAFT
jgi:hypothetical protein